VPKAIVDASAFVPALAAGLPPCST